MSLIKIEIQYDTAIGDLFVPKDATHYYVNHFIEYDHIQVYFSWYKQTKTGKWKQYIKHGEYWESISPPLNAIKI